MLLICFTVIYVQVKRGGSDFFYFGMFLISVIWADARAFAGFSSAPLV